MKKVCLLMLCILFFTALLIIPQDTSAYSYHGARQCSILIYYHWGDRLKSSSLIKTAFTRAINDWNTKISRRSFSEDRRPGGELNTWNDPTQPSLYGRSTWKYKSNGCITSWTAKINVGSPLMRNATPARSTAGHELGHVLGLDHSNKTAIMNSNRNRSSIYIPQRDDINGVNNLYPF